MQISQKDFVREVSQRTGIRQADIKLCLEQFLSVIKEILSNDDTIIFKEFGKFYPYTMQEKKIKDPRGKKCVVPCHRTAKFTASKIFNKQLNEKYGLRC